MIDNRASLCNSTDTIADFVVDPVALMLELEIREIAPEKVVGILPVMTQMADRLIWQTRIRVLYRTSRGIDAVRAVASEGAGGTVREPQGDYEGNTSPDALHFMHNAAYGSTTASS
jgi:hypothetical protein